MSRPHGDRGPHPGAAWAVALVALCGTTAPLLGQADVRGRVVDRASGDPVTGATVQMGGLPVVVTSETGEFRFSRVQAGRYELRILALGYADYEQALLIRKDTLLAIEMDVAPVQLDTLGVRGRNINVRGRVREKGTRIPLIDVDVQSSVDRRTHTNAAGRFKLSRVPADLPVAVHLRGFGYLPFDTIVESPSDTTLDFELEVDPLVQRMIDVQVQRLDTRSKPFQAVIMPVIDREDLLRNMNMSALDLIKSKYRIFLGRVHCIMIDDRQSYNGIEELDLFLPDRLERIEFLFRGAMLRIYTRNHMAKMLGSNKPLARPSMTPSKPPAPPLCT